MPGKHPETDSNPGRGGYLNPIQKGDHPTPVDPVRLREYRAASKAEATKRAFEKNWRGFEKWCSGHQVAGFPCPPETLEAFLVHLAEQGLKASSIDQARWAINARHKWANLPPPGDSERVRVVMAGIRRTIGSRQHRKAALTIEHLREVTFRSDLIGRRDKALLLLGFAAGLRRSELAGLEVEDLQLSPEILRVHLRRSRTDQDGRGEWVDVVPAASPRCCPLVALREWLIAAELEGGPVFRAINRWGALGGRISTAAIGHIVKQTAAACGLDPSQYGSHSLRAGCATYLLDHGVPLNIVAKQGRWKKSDTVLRYDRNATAKALTGVY